MVDMERASLKLSIFNNLKGPHDQRFVAFNDMPEGNSKYRAQQSSDFQSGSGRTKPVGFPFKEEVYSEIPDYSPNKDFVLRSTTIGHHGFGKFPARKPVVDPKLKGPQLFYDPTFKRRLYTLDAKSPVVRPDFEVLGGRRQSDKCYSIKNCLPRDNKMYRLTDTWNLEK
jgi:hypothetical protein